MSNIDLEKYIPENMTETEFMVKFKEMMQYVLDAAHEEMKDVKYKYTQPSELSDATVKEVIKEQGFNYIVDVLNTVDGLEFNTMLSFMDLINQLKGSRQGLELVMKLMGFDSIIQEWWEDEIASPEPWSYEIIVIVNASFVPDIFDTIEKLKVFSDNYVLAQISNIDVRFSADKFAERGAIMGGFETPRYIGVIRQRGEGYF